MEEHNEDMDSKIDAGTWDILSAECPHSKVPCEVCLIDRLSQIPEIAEKIAKHGKIVRAEFKDKEENEED